ncbi:MAG: glucose-6-phosphate isomerase [Gemmatimonadetes bacterium]|nr:glucose-6-phosphate isomerase [Gemmatimonadota bacterium]
MDAIRLDYGNFMAPRLPGGVDPSTLSGRLTLAFETALSALSAWREEGDLGFLDLPYATDSVARVTELADGLGQSFDDIVVLGIGGSGLGAIALRDALLGPFWNQRSAEERDHFPRLHVLSNPDPHTFRRLMKQIDPARALFNVVSKSGATAETMAQYLVVRELLDGLVGPDNARSHFLFTTDSTSGALRRIGDAEGVAMLPVPDNVGGRFSVLSPVGLLPAAVCGADIGALLSGAAEMESRCRTNALSSNPAGILACLLHHADTGQGRPIHVMMPYADRLRSTALWFQQLWAESLGKRTTLSGEDKPTGPTPLAALGATDQHSLLQLLMEGPADKVVLFVAVDDPGAFVLIPQRHSEIDALSYLGGHSLGELLAAEHTATAEALRRAGRPNATIHLPAVNAHALGQLIMLLQIATVLAGSLYGVDPMNQPGVELGKQLTYGLMGRTGVPAPEIAEADPRWVL